MNIISTSNLISVVDVVLKILTVKDHMLHANSFLTRRSVWLGCSFSVAKPGVGYNAWLQSVFSRRTLSCEFGNSGIVVLSNDENDSEVLSVGGDSFPEISFVAIIKQCQRFSSSDQTIWRKKSKRWLINKASLASLIRLWMLWALISKPLPALDNLRPS